MKKTILGTGLNGLVASRLVKDFSNTYEFSNLDLRDPIRPVDITDYEQVLKALEQSDADLLLHFAAFTDVSAAWQQRDDKTALCYQVNVEGTRNIVKACEQTSKHLVHISTAYVFDGQKNEPYIETDLVKPIEWYGQTKAEAEAIVQNSNLNWTILRIDQPFRSDDFPKIDTLHRVIAGLKKQELYPQFTDHFFGPTFVDDFARVVDFFIRTKTTGLFHASSGESWNDYDFASTIAQFLKSNFSIKKASVHDYLKTSQRPYQINTAMNNSKLQKILDFSLTPIKKAIEKAVLETKI